MASKALPPALQRLIENLSMLPGIGEKTATRLALTVLRWPQNRAKELGHSIMELHERIKLCSMCFTFSEDDPCSICSDQKRDHSIICIIEDPGDIVAIEKAGVFNGLYHVLHGALSPMDGIGPQELKINELLVRIDNSKKQGIPIKEIIIATSSTAQGEATASYLSDLLTNKGVKVSRIACGIPMGMDIKYADPMTLKQAISARNLL